MIGWFFKSQSSQLCWRPVLTARWDQPRGVVLWSLMQLTLISVAKTKEWTIEKLKSDWTSRSEKTGDRENNGPASATRRKETADKIDFSDCDSLCAAIFPCFGRCKEGLPPSGRHTEIHLSLLLPPLSASFTPHGSPEIDGALVWLW